MRPTATRRTAFISTAGDPWQEAQDAQEFDHHEPILMDYPLPGVRQGLHTKAEYGAFLDRIDGELGEQGILPYQRR